MTIEELVISFIGKTQNKSADEVSSLLFDINEADKSKVLKADALNSLYEWDKSRVQNHENEKKALYDKGFNKAKAESLSKFEEEIRGKFQITEDKKGLELIDAILATKSTAGTGEVDDEKIKASKIFNDTIAQLKKEKTDAVKEWVDKYEGREKQLQKEATFKSIVEDAKTFVKGLNPILPEDAKKAERQLSILIKDLETEFEYEVQEGGKKILKKDGKVVCDAHGHPVSFEDVIKEKASLLWDFKKAEEREGTGNKNETGGAGDKGGYNGPVPKNEEEYNKLISEVKNDADGIAITKAWISSQTKS